MDDYQVVRYGKPGASVLAKDSHPTGERPVNAHQRRAAALARRISEHHQDCTVCRAGGQVEYTRRGVTRVRCRVEQALFAELAREQEAGWPR